MLGKDEKIPAKVVFVRNKNNKKDWIAFICTNPDLSEEEIIRIYGKRWQIEVFFKTCKSYLNLISECHCPAHDVFMGIGSDRWIKEKRLQWHWKNSIG